MSRIVSSFDAAVNFWEVNPQLKAAGIFKEYYSNDKTKGKTASSKVMWFIALVADLESKYYGLVFEERVQLLEEDILMDVGFYQNNKVLVDSLIEFYTKIADTPAERHLRQWDDTLEKRTKFLKQATYELDTFDKLDKMAANTQSIYKTMTQIKKDIELERTGGGTAKGNSMESLSDTGEI